MFARPPRVLRFGLFDAHYSRNRTTAAAFSTAGAELRELRIRVLDDLGDRLQPSRDVGALARLGIRVLRGELQLALAVPRPLVWADAVLFGYPGQWDVAFWAPLLRRACRRIVFDPLVTLTETFVEDRRLVAPGSWRARVLRLLDRQALRTADHILADTPQQATYWAALSGVSLERFVILPVGADESLFRVQRRAAVGARDDAPERLRVLFYGTYSPLHGAETIVDALHRLERAGEPISLVMIGTGQFESAVRQRAAALGLRAVEFVQWVSEAELADWIAWADVVLGIFGATAKAARVVPNKVYQAMAMGAAIVTRDSPAIRWLAGGEEIARLVPPADPDALADALRELRIPERRAALAVAARTRYEAVASDRARASCLRPLLQELSRRHSGERGEECV
ncbi:glycosyltransferase family 4 protein [Thermomicrobium sp. CFH 73360]|uniref:glycosyltransferase family 4 protein n=1 Tax=Thermomicrobium sp. CFH 73360 TaxID=2951987 RepID=UPI0020769159|nr:glycosyltransferase family 4 protein [Thermomicrobium sp. CFH 73360]MCM8745176.1 glycosyltransferase family 4 protein [Thermomicrobium sp. CFH 73360]